MVAKRTEASTPEQFGLDIAAHFLKMYPILSACQIEVKKIPLSSRARTTKVHWWGKGRVRMPTNAPSTHQPAQD